MTNRVINNLSTSNVNNACTGNVSLPLSKSGNIKTQSGTNSPIINGKLHYRTNPYDMSYNEYQDSFCWVVLGVNPDGSPHALPGNVQTCYGYEPSPELSKDNTDLKALNSLGNNIRGHSFDGSVFLANAKESMQTLTDSANRLHGALVEILRGNYLRALERLADAQKNAARDQLSRLQSQYSGVEKTGYHLSANILNWNYGIAPLMDDVKKAAEALAAELESERNYSASGSASSRATGVHKKTRRRYKSRYRANLKAKLSISTQLGLNNPAALVWEATPYSFVCDWFLPIGSYLNSIGNANYYGRTGSKSSKDEFTVGPASNPSRVGGDAAYWRSVIFKRELVDMAANNVPLPDFIPVQNAFSFKRMQNAIALLTTSSLRSRLHDLDVRLGIIN